MFWQRVHENLYVYVNTYRCSFAILAGDFQQRTFVAL